MKKCTYKDCTHVAAWTASADVPKGYVNHCVDHVSVSLRYKPIDTVKEVKEPITKDVIMDMAKIAVISTADFV